MKTLQYAFIESKGAPLDVNGQVVQQIDKLKIREGLVVVKLISPLNGSQGVCLKAPGGGIVLSNGSTAEAVHIWNEGGLPSTIEHAVRCPTGELRIWNVYRIRHRNGTITEEAWTGNAGMVVTAIDGNTRTYECSDGTGDFNPRDFIFSVSLNRVS